ncbi:hypothetical protein Tco_1008229 [Tanacetum coccineum]
MGDEHLSTIPEKELDEVIKSSVEDLVPIPSEFEDTSEGDSEYDFPSCDDFSSINVPCDNFVTLSNPLFDSNDDFTSSDDELLSDEDVPEDNDIESEDSYVSKLDERDFLVTPLSAFNKDECFDPGGDNDEIDTFLDIVVSLDFEDDYYDSEGDIIYLESLLIMDTILNLPPEVFFDRDPKSLKDELDNDNFKSMVKGSDLEVSFPSGTRNKIFDPGIFFEVQSKRFLSRDTFSISFIRNFIFLVIETFLPFSSENEDKVFNPGILSFNILSHQGKITFDFSESPMMISVGDIPFLDVMFLHFYPP